MDLKKEFQEWITQQPTITGQKYSSGSIYTWGHMTKFVAPRLGCTEEELYAINDAVAARKMLERLDQISDELDIYEPEVSNSRDLYAHFLAVKFNLGAQFWQNYRKLSTRLRANNYYINEDELSVVPEANSAKPRQLIFHGAPGTGKSYELESRVDEFDHHARVTFHPAMSYAQFVGGLRPSCDEHGQIKYAYELGVFGRFLREALAASKRGDDEQFLFIIEEINRADVAAVFGDIFQLLDRDASGTSAYALTPPPDLATALGLECGEDLRLPGNLYIWATCNNSDAGVNPMDTAFKRRWEFEYMPLNPAESIQNFAPLSEQWNADRCAINAKLQCLGVDEDRQLGFYFLKPSELASDETYQHALKNKVFAYLYFDLLRFRRGEFFKQCADFAELTREHCLALTKASEEVNED